MRYRTLWGCGSGEEGTPTLGPPLWSSLDCCHTRGSVIDPGYRETSESPDYPDLGLDWTGPGPRLHLRAPGSSSRPVPCDVPLPPTGPSHVGVGTPDDAGVCPCPCTAPTTRTSPSRPEAPTASGPTWTGAEDVGLGTLYPRRTCPTLNDLRVPSVHPDPPDPPAPPARPTSASLAAGARGGKAERQDVVEPEGRGGHLPL